MLFFKPNPLKKMKSGIKKANSISEIVEVVNTQISQMNLTDFKIACHWLNCLRGSSGFIKKQILSSKVVTIEDFQEIFYRILTDKNENLSYILKIGIFSSLSRCDKTGVINKLVFDEGCGNTSILNDIKCTEFMISSTKFSCLDFSNFLSVYIKNKSSNIYNNQKFISQGFHNLMSGDRIIKSLGEAVELLAWWMDTNSITVEKNQNEILDLFGLGKIYDEKNDHIFDLIFLHQLKKGRVEECLFNISDEWVVLKMIEHCCIKDRKRNSDIGYTVDDVKSMFQKRKILDSIGEMPIEDKPKRRKM